MSRIARKNINTSFFHIMVQGINREYIFNSNKDKEKYLSILKDVQNDIHIKILSYCVMDNHTHLLIFEENINKITEFMHKVNSKYAGYYNKKYDRVGYVFRDRYRTQPIFSERHLLLCINYIHNNPVKAGIISKPDDYKYSSYNYNIFKKDEDIENNIRNYIESGKIQKTSDEEFVFMEIDKDKQQIFLDIISEVLKNKNLKKEELKNHKDILKIIIKKLKNENKISFRKMEELLGISREVLRKI